ncbi:MAG: glycosyltransferase family A protein [Rubrivivax sp.]|nr:glycosyltransferase family A protein [Rubrivivax sp.]
MNLVPELSVIVPTYNRSAVLVLCVQALCRQTCDSSRFEIVVSDDGSQDDTAAAVATLAAQSSIAIRYLHQANAGANRARNRAIAVARGRLLLFINDDTLAQPQMLAEHLQEHALHPDERVAVLGRMTVSPGLPPSRLAPLHLDRAFVGLQDGAVLDWRAFFTCNVSVKRSLLDRGGLFEERLRYHEDLELAWRLSAHGLRVVYRSQALGWHEHFLAEDEFLAIAAREARALCTWAQLAPQARPVLASLGFEPALPWPRRLRHRVLGAVINRHTEGLWRWLARTLPQQPAALRRLTLALYDQLYQSRKREALRDTLQQAAKHA